LVECSLELSTAIIRNQGKNTKNSASEASANMEYVVRGRTDVREVNHVFLSLLYFEKRQAEAEHELGSGAARNIPNHVLGREHQRNEPVSDPFQNMERISGNEDMTNRALKKVRRSCNCCN
jgi:hypothetical protein